MDLKQLVPSLGHMPTHAIASWGAVLGITALIVCMILRKTYGSNVRMHALINTAMGGIVGGIGLLHQRAPHDIGVFILMEVGAFGLAVACFYYAAKLKLSVAPSWSRAGRRPSIRRPNRNTRTESRFWLYYIGLGSYAAMLVPAPFEGHFFRWVEGIFALIIIGLVLYRLGIVAKLVYRERKEQQQERQLS